MRAEEHAPGNRAMTNLDHHDDALHDHQDHAPHADHDDHDHEDDHDDHAHGAHDDHDHGAPGWWGRVRELLRPHRHDAADSYDRELADSAAGIQTVQVSLLGLGLTAVLQLAVSLASGSVALLADTIHNFADASTAVPLWLAFSLGRRPPNRRYTYGYGRAEDLAGVFVVLVIAGSAAVAAFESVKRLLQPEPVTHLGWVALAALIGFAGNEAVAQYRIRTGQRIGSAALLADGQHARADSLTSLAVLIGAAGAWAGFPQADALVGLAITVAILVILRDTAMQMWRRLMDAVDPELVAQVEAAGRSAAGVQEVRQVQARWIGHSIHAEAHIVADAGLNLRQAHDVAERARHAMLHAAPKLATVTVHVDPSEQDGDDPHAELEHHRRGRGPLR